MENCTEGHLIFILPKWLIGGAIQTIRMAKLAGKMFLVKQWNSELRILSRTVSPG